MKADSKQIQLIHIAKSKLKMDDETYREILASYKVSSSKDLTYAQATRLISALRKKGFALKPKKKTKPDKREESGISDYQLNLIAFLADQYPWKYENGFILWLRKQDAKGEIVFTNDKLGSSWDASFIIEKLKQMLRITTAELESSIVPFLEWQKDNPVGTFKEWKNSDKERA